MKNINKISTVILCFLLIQACTYDFPPLEEPTAGEADFTKTIAVGSGLTAGFMNGTLYTAGQNHSFVNIVTEQMKQVGGGAFNQPGVNSENGCFNPAGGCTQGRLYLKIVGTSPAPVNTTGDGGVSLAPFADKANLNNFGVPGVTLALTLIPATGGPPPPAPNPAFNPYYARIASSPSADGATGSTIIGDAAAALANGGTFFIFWLGNDDVLGYAVGGASNPAILTSAGDFGTRFNAALGAILAANANAKGVVANIPDITSIPYFTTVAWNPIPLDAPTAGAVNSGFAGYNQILDALKGPPFNYTAAEVDARKVSFAAGANNKIVILDETVNDYGDEFDALESGGAITPEQRAALVPYEQIRQTTANDLVTLSAGAVLGTLVGGDPTKVNGVTVPIADQYILIPAEITQIQNSIDEFNGIIANAVSANSATLAFVDANAILGSLKTSGASIGGSTLTASISPPFGGFSLDGVHPNPRGMGFLANKFIEAINTKFKSSIPLCNPNDFAGNALPVP